MNSDDRREVYKATAQRATQKIGEKDKADEDDLEVDLEKLDRNKYAGILKKKDPERERLIAREGEPDMQIIRSPVLRRQEIRDAFGRRGDRAAAHR